MFQKISQLAAVTLLPLAVLTACGGSEEVVNLPTEKQVGEATCQDYYNAVDDPDAESSGELLEQLSRDSGVNPSDPDQSESLTYQAFAYCGIDVQNFLRGDDIELEEPGKKLADFTYDRQAPLPMQQGQ